MNKIIAVDIDGVCANLAERWLELYNTDYDDHLTKSDWTGWNVEKFVKPECEKKIYDYLKRRDLYEQVLPIDGAWYGIKTLREMGNRIIFPTSSPIESSGVKFIWLKEYGFIESQKDYIEVSDKGLVRADLLIDDYEVNLNSFQGIRLLFNQPWNQHVHDFYRCMNWEQVVQTVTRISIVLEGACL